MKTYIFGHKKPDTDAVVAAMAVDFLEKNRGEKAAYPNTEAVIIDPLNPETTFLLDKFGVEAPKLITATDIKPADEVILVDHNEQLQRLDGLNPDQIVEIIDHHKVNLNLSQPINILVRTWGSSCTVVYSLMKKANVVPDKKLAALMLAAILSDTTGYKSATCTPIDQKYGAELAQIAGIGDVAAFTLEIFKAKSNVSSLTNKQIVTNDYKIFDFAGKKVLIDQLETVEQAKVLQDKKAGLLQAMAEVKSAEKVDLLFVAISDILQVNTKLLILSDQEKAVAERAFGGRVEDNTLDIGPKLSRKKEIAPAIEKAVS